MGNNVISKMKKDGSIPTIPRTIVKGGPKAKFQKQKKEIPQAAIATVVTEVARGEDERKSIQKTKNRFRHFIFTETSPAITPDGLIRKALEVLPGVYRLGTSYVLYAHDPSCSEGCSHIRASIGKGIHYHLLIRSDDPAQETIQIKKAAAAFVYIENSFYQVPVQCPLTTYYELHTRENTSLMVKVGGGIFDMFRRVIQRGVLKPLSRINNEPIWECHKHSQILAQEQLIAIVNAGPYRSVLSQLLGTLVEKEGSVSFEQHGWRLSLECGPANYQCPCGGCLGSTQAIQSSVYGCIDPLQDETQLIPPPAQVTYSTAGECASEGNDRAYEYMDFQPKTEVMDYEYGSGQQQQQQQPQQTQSMEYELMEDLMKDPPAHPVSTTDEELDEVIRLLANPHEQEEEEEEDGIPKPSATSVDFQ
jgi:hypothetical protein